MSIKIITGDYRGRNIQTPDEHDPTSPIRPTKGMVRQAMFNMIFARTDFDNLNVLDLFSGSGGAGLECLSRGAGHVTFVDTNPKYTRENVEAFKVEANRYSILTSDALKFKPQYKADLIFADPPYGAELIPALLNRKDELGQQGTLWMLEFERGFMLDVDESKFNILKQKRFGKTMVFLLEQK